MLTAAIAGVLFVPAAIYLGGARCEPSPSSTFPESASAASSPAAGGRLVDLGIEAAKRAHPTCTFREKDEHTIAVTCPEKTEGEIRLDNLERLVGEMSAEERDRAVAELVEAFEPEVASPNATTIRENLVPLVRSTSNELCPPQIPVDQCPPTYPLFADLVLVYAVDRELGIAHLPRPELEMLGLAEPDLRDLALSNLARKMPQGEVQGDDGPMRMLVAGGNYESSLLLFPSVWEGLPFRGSPLAVVVARDLLLFADDAMPGAAAALRESSKRLIEKVDHPISTTVLRRVNGTWEPVVDFEE